MSAEQQLLRAIDDLMASFKLSDIEELVIEDMKIEEFSDAVREKLEELKYLESLVVVRCSLVRLTNLPKLESLLRIQLDHNFIEGSQLVHLSAYKKVISLSLMDNRIESIEDLGVLGTLPNLLQLNLFRNPVQNQAGYRMKGFEIMPKLILLDNLYQDGSEVILDDEVKQQESRQQQDSRRRTSKQQNQQQQEGPSDGAESSNNNENGNQRRTRKRVRRNT